MRIIIALFLMFGLISCVKMITKSHLNLSKGTTLTTFKKEDVDFDKNVLLSKMNTKNQGKYEVFMTEISGATKKEVYYYAFRNDSLLYWGHPYQFTRSENQILREIAEEAFDYAKKEYGLD